MKIHDISMTVHDQMMVYGNHFENRPKLEVYANHDTHSHYETKITMNMHNGTHIDAPLHMIKDSGTMEGYSIDRFISKAKVLDLTYVEGQITAKDLQEKEISKDDVLLLKTRNSWDEDFNPNFVFVDRTAAEYLVKCGIKSVGIDSLGIERSQKDHMTHIQLLEKGIMIIEGLCLKDIEEGSYTLIVLPIKIEKVEAAPARAVLIEGELEEMFK